MRQGYGVRIVNPRISSRDMLNIISALAQAQHGLGAQDKKSVWAFTNFPTTMDADSTIPQVCIKRIHNNKRKSDVVRFNSNYLF